jgi:Domain of unknown function (DUF1911)/Domain of unknown function (DUF1910)
MNTLLTIEEFKQHKRELMLDYKNYEKNFNESVDTFDKIKQGLAQPTEVLQKLPAAGLMSATRHGASEAVDHLTTCYSAGHALPELREFYPAALEYWESYAKYDEAYDTTAEEESQRGHPHFALPGDAYEQVNRMVCFSILLGWGNLMPRLLKVIDYNNHQPDGMLERIFAFYVDDRGPQPDECTRHLPYFKTLKIFAAPKNKRPELMAEYLEDWYEASRRESYHDSHDRSDAIFFKGYWSWEAAAITYLLDINDSSYRDAEFYPKDLVAFARQLDKETKDAMPVPEQERQRLRVEGGQPCTQAGYWFTPAKQGSRRQFKKGEIMPVIEGSQYGATIWQWAKEQ